MSKKYIEQASAVPFKYFNGDIKILLITSRNEKKWIIPKGIIENHQTPRQAALAEAFEEAGVEGVLHDIKMGVYYYSKWNSTCRVHVFALNVQNEHHEWDEDFFRKRKWYNLEDALNKVKSKDLKKLMSKLTEIIEKNEN